MRRHKQAIQAWKHSAPPRGSLESLRQTNSARPCQRPEVANTFNSRSERTVLVRYPSGEAHPAPEALAGAGGPFNLVALEAGTLKLRLLWHYDVPAPITCTTVRLRLRPSARSCRLQRNRASDVRHGEARGWSMSNFSLNSSVGQSQVTVILCSHRSLALASNT